MHGGFRLIPVLWEAEEGEFQLRPCLKIFKKGLEQLDERDWVQSQELGKQQQQQNNFTTFSERSQSQKTTHCKASLYG